MAEINIYSDADFSSIHTLFRQHGGKGHAHGWKKIAEAFNRTKKAADRRSEVALKSFYFRERKRRRMSARITGNASTGSSRANRAPRSKGKLSEGRWLISGVTHLAENLRREKEKNHRLSEENKRLRAENRSLKTIEAEAKRMATVLGTAFTRSRSAMVQHSRD